MGGSKACAEGNPARIRDKGNRGTLREDIGRTSEPKQTEQEMEQERRESKRRESKTKEGGQCVDDAMKEADGIARVIGRKTPDNDTTRHCHKHRSGD